MEERTERMTTTQRRQAATRLRNWEVYHIPSTVSNDVTRDTDKKDRIAMERAGYLREFGATHPIVHRRDKKYDPFCGAERMADKIRAERHARREAAKRK